jgi:phage recombination protein Bet
MSKVQPQDQKMVVYKAKDGQEVQLTIDIVRNFLVTGHKELVTLQEFVYYMGVCKARGLNPYAKDCYLIKYGEKDPAAIIVAIDFYRARAKAQPDCVGWEKGVICLSKKTGELRYSKGIVLKDEELIGGWFRATPEGWEVPFELEVNLEGYIKKTKDGSITAFWKPEKQATQIAKVAESQGLRTIFPDEFRGTITAEEVGLQLENFETIDIQALKTSTVPEPEPIDTSEFDKLVAEKLAYIKDAEELKVRLQHVEEVIKAIATAKSTKTEKVTPEQVKAQSVIENKFEPYPAEVPDPKDPKKTITQMQLGFWKFFLGWEANHYPPPAPAASAPAAAASSPPEEEPPSTGPGVAPEDDDIPFPATGPGSDEAAPSTATATDPTFDGRRLAVWNTIIDRQIPLMILAEEVKVTTLQEITPENLAAVKMFADNYQPPRGRGRGKK